MDEFALIIGTGNAPLGRAVATELGMTPALCKIERFPDGEISVTLQESVRGRPVFIVQPTCPPVDGNLVELLALIDACRRASAARVIAVLPYFGYARSDKRHHGGEPIMASALATVFHGAGVDHVITIDLHTAQIEGFFHIPVDSLSAVPVLCEAMRERLPEDIIVVSPDEGRVKTATAYARLLGAPVGVVHKERMGGDTTRAMHVVGDVRGKACLIIDDMISTGGTLAGAISQLLVAGARPEIFIAATHGLFLEGALGKLGHEAVREIFVTDTVEIEPQSTRLRVVSAAPLIAAAIVRIALKDGRLPGSRG